MSEAIQITDKTKCSGCTACANACPKNAILMKPDQEGFLYPEVQKALCISCGICQKVCPVQSYTEPATETACYIVRNRDEAVLKDSTSGGAFTAFASAVIENNGIVYGTGYDENMRVVCKQARTVEQLVEMRGSKFVQSELGDTYRQIKAQLQQGETVLFTGTPCQIEGLLAYLGEKPNNLICIDFVCRGVPSPKLWENYVRTMENKYRSKMVGAKFKNKTYGYHATTMKVDFENGKTYYGSGRVDPMMKAFVTELASRPSCFSCAFKTVNRNSDITMFDCYGFSRITSLPDDNKGYSSLLVHSEKGRELMNAVQNQFILYEADVEEVVGANGIMVRRSARPNSKRDQYYQLADTQTIDSAMAQIEPITAKDWLIEFSKNPVYKFGLIQVIKKYRSRSLR